MATNAGRSVLFLANQSGGTCHAGAGARTSEIAISQVPGTSTICDASDSRTTAESVETRPSTLSRSCWRPATLRCVRPTTAMRLAGIRVSGDHVCACGKSVRRLERDHATRRNGKVMNSRDLRAHERQTHRRGLRWQVDKTERATRRRLHVGTRQVERDRYWRGQ
eukprot:6495860-Prymnesium_polylepis.2